ncbi:hypothetical protein ACFFTN_18490 [Aminobacter aganoensis]|uniref:Uncharacterized protein n=1 Tax=Aminobacter aganoensis TaxID=83264 RepID=A0A7X0KIN2_9HYPH|nr:hypothetical protein [Aminobacter aganoensis]MBB6352768.1 hypothetical protein [Aminobacter aganoensis]
MVSLYLTNRSVGLFVRGQRGEGFATTLNRLSAFEPGLGQALGVSLRGEYKLCYLHDHPVAMMDPANWSAAHVWLERQEEHFSKTLADIVVGA